MYQPKTGQKCFCKRGIERDNCSNCEGTGFVIDFKAIREKNLVQIKIHNGQLILIEQNKKN